jgi:hypothetical protein
MTAALTLCLWHVGCDKGIRGEIKEVVAVNEFVAVLIHDVDVYVVA